MAPTALVVLTTLATDADARTLVTALLAERLIACGTLLPGGRSMYRWEGEVNEESEVVVLLKTDVSRWEALCRAVRERHPYEVPELLALGRSRERGTAGRARRALGRSPPLHCSRARPPARAPERSGARRRPRRVRGRAVAQRTVERSGAVPAARGGGRARPRGRLVPAGRGSQ